MNLLSKFGVGSGLAALFAMFSTSAFAQTTIDVSSATGSLGEVAAAVALIGAAMIAAISAGIAFRWVVAYLAK